MSTRSNVGIKVGNEFKYIYVHFDGYPSGVGATLRKHYQDPYKVRDLIDLGDCSVLGEELRPSRDGFDGEYIDRKGSLFYGRDRGDPAEGVKARTENWDEYINAIAEDAWIEFIYVYEDGKWKGYHNEPKYDKDFNLIEGKLVEVDEREYDDA